MAMRLLLITLLCMPVTAFGQTFKNVSAQLNLEGEATGIGGGMGGGVSWFDANGDGLLDLLMTPAIAPPVLYVQQKDGKGFAEAEDAIIPDTPPAKANGHIVLDIDNDGDTDVLLFRETENVLLRNDQGTFKDVSSTQLPGSGLWGVSGAIGDYDGDGDDDILIANYISGVSFPKHQCARNALLENDGKGYFRDRALEFGLTKAGCSLAATFSDYDNDGDLDMMAINDFGHFVVPNELYRNDGPDENGSWKFTDVSEESGFAQVVYGMGIAAADINHDGFMDYFVTSIGRPVLLTGNATGSFDDATELYGLSVPLADTGYQVTWGAVFEDFNGDGALDLLAAGGHIPAISYLGNQDEMPNMLWQGTPNPPWTADPTGWVLQQIEESSGRSLSIADFNQDGRADIALGHASGVIALYQNLSKVDPPLRLQLKPNVTGPRGAGARVSVQSGDCTRYFESNGGGSYGGTYDPKIRITLPSKCITSEPIELSIRWPSGYLQSLTATLGQSLTLSEPQWLWFEGNNLIINWPETQSIEITATGAVMEKTLPNPDGTWSAQFAPEMDVTTALFSIKRNGKLLPVHPRKEWSQPNTVTLRSHPQLVTVGSPFALHMTLLDADGKAPDAGSQVKVLSGNNAYKSKHQGLGIFVTNITAPATTGPFEFQVIVDNKALGGMQSIDIKALIDPSQSQQIISGLYKSPDAPLTPENATFNIQVKLRDHNGSMVIAEADGFTLMVNAEPVVPTEVISSDNEALLIIDPSLIPDQAEVQLLHKGFPVAAPQTAHILNAPQEQSAFIDAERSFCATAMTKFHADGQDVATTLLFLSDKHGNILLPATADLQFNTSNTTLVSGSLHAKDDFYQMKFRAEKEVGAAMIEVSAFGLSTGINCSFTLLPPQQPPAALSNELSTIKASPTKLPVDGLGTSYIRVIPRLPGGRAYGSGLNMNISSNLSDFTGPTQYFGGGRYTRVLKAGAKAGFATISAKMSEPDFLVQTLVTFFEDNNGSEDTGTDPDTTVIEEEVVEESPEQAPESSIVEEIETVEEVGAELPATVEDTPDAGTTLPDEAAVVETDAPENDATVSPVEEDEKLPTTSDGGCAITTHTTHNQPMGVFFIWLLLGTLYICHHRQRGDSFE